MSGLRHIKPTSRKGGYISGVPSSQSGVWTLRQRYEQIAAPLLEYFPGAAAAYSLRQLSYAYTGPVITARRASDSAEAEFTASEVSDGTLAAWSSGGDAFVKVWHDQSGNNRDASQTTTGYQPKIVDGGSVVLEEGKPAIEFDGNDDYLSNALTVWGRNGVRPFWSFGVVNANTTASDFRTFAAARKVFSPFDGWQMRCNSSSTGAFFAVDYNGSDSDSATSFDDIRDRQFLYSVTLDNTPSIWIDGAVNVSLAEDGISTSYTPSVTTMTIGAAGTTASAFYHLKGTMQEFLLYFADMAAYRERIEDNIAWSYSQ